MLKRTVFAAVMALLPGMASAVTVTAINDYATALAEVTPSESLDLSGTWTAPPLIINPDASSSGQYRSPYETAAATVPGIGTAAGYFSVGIGSTYAGTGNPAILALNTMAKSVSLLWGSPDGYNTLKLFNGATPVTTILGNQFNILAFEASFVTISADSAAEYFDRIEFSSTQNAFEFSNVTVAPVPLPASALLLLGGVGVLVAGKRRKASKA